MTLHFPRSPSPRHLGLPPTSSPLCCTTYCCIHFANIQVLCTHGSRVFHSGSPVSAVTHTPSFMPYTKSMDPWCATAPEPFHTQRRRLGGIYAAMRKAGVKIRKHLGSSYQPTMAPPASLQYPTAMNMLGCAGYSRQPFQSAVSNSRRPFSKGMSTCFSPRSDNSVRQAATDEWRW